MSNQKNEFYLVCDSCGFKLPKSKFEYICPECKQNQNTNTPPIGVFKTEYNYEAIKSICHKNDLFNYLNDSDFIDLLPIKSTCSLGPLKVGKTPLYNFEFKNSITGNFNFYLKDDSQNPTFSFKDRASQLVSAYAKENNITNIVAASTGNAGSSLAGICASQKQNAIIIVPKSAPIAKLLQIVMYGAKLVLVDGNYDKAFELSIEASNHFGWFNRNTAYNPFTIEGKKTVSFEIFKQLSQNIPSIIFVSVGDGVIISGIYKGFEDLLKLGLINRIPIICAVQSEKSDNLVRNINSDEFEMRKATTIADSISVDYPRNFYMTQKFLKKYHGKWIIVSDEEIIEASETLAKNTGIFSEPAGAAAMAGMLKFMKQHPLEIMESMLVVSTGAGLKDTKTPLANICLPDPIRPNLSDLNKFIEEFK